MYLTHHGGKSVVAERFIKTLKIKEFIECVTWVLTNRCIDKLDDAVNKYINTHHSTIKMNPINIKSSTYIGFLKENKEIDPKFKIGDIARISKCKKFFCKRLHSKLVWRSFYD